MAPFDEEDCRKGVWDTGSIVDVPGWIAGDGELSFRESGRIEVAAHRAGILSDAAN